MECLYHQMLLLDVGCLCQPDGPVVESEGGSRGSLTKIIKPNKDSYKFATNPGQMLIQEKH